MQIWMIRNTFFMFYTLSTIVLSFSDAHLIMLYKDFQGLHIESRRSQRIMNTRHLFADIFIYTAGVKLTDKSCLPKGIPQFSDVVVLPIKMKRLKFWSSKGSLCVKSCHDYGIPNLVMIVSDNGTSYHYPF
jgi:hypothetical protein